MKPFTLKPSEAQTESVTGETVELITDAQPFSQVNFILDLTAAATATADTLDVYVDVSFDNETWINAVHFTQILGDGGAKRELAKLTVGELNDPDAVLDVASDASAGVTRNVGITPFIRYRSVIVDDGTDNASFTYSLEGYAQ